MIDMRTVFVVDAESKTPIKIWEKQIESIDWYDLQIN